MKPQTLHEKRTSEGNLFAEQTFAMEVDLKNTHHIMSVLTNMYSDRILACIREYATNARDAHLAAGNGDKPIKVILPNTFSQNFIIRDFGPGLSIDDLRDMYRYYGASTKRDSDEFNGVLGIGAKAALTYTPTFQIRSFHGGMRHEISVSTNEDGIGEINVIASVPSTEPNGVEISIPVKAADRREFEVKAKQFFAWWERGTFTGLEPLKKTPISTMGKVKTYPKNEVSQDLIVMGGVAYPIPYDGGLFPVDRDFSIVYFADMGEVQFAPSREALMTTGLTKRTVENVRSNFRKDLEDKIHKEIKAAKTITHALIIANNAYGKYPTLDLELKWKGNAIPSFKSDVFDAPFVMKPQVDWKGNPVLGVDGKQKIAKHVIPLQYVLPQERTTPSPHNAFQFIRRYYTRDSEITLDSIDTHIIVTDAPKEVKAHHRKYVRDFDDLQRQNGNSQYQVYVFTSASAAPAEKWLMAVRKISFADLKKEVNDAKPASATSDRTIYEVYENGTLNRRRVADDEKVLYTTSAIRSESDGYLNIYTVANSWTKPLGYDKLVVMPRNRWDKFQREHPNAKNWKDVLRGYPKMWYDGLSDERKRALRFYLKFSGHRFAENVNIRTLAPKVKDKALREFWAECDEHMSVGRTLQQQHQAILTTMARVSIITTDEDRLLKPDKFSPDQKMVDTLNYYEQRVDVHSKHNEEIINALYEYTRKGK